MATTLDFKLPENLTIANVQKLHEQFEELVNTPDCDQIQLLANEVNKTDTAGVQLLLALVSASKERQINVLWDKPSSSLKSAATLLGLDAPLGIH